MDFRYNDFGHCHARLPNAGLGNKLFVWARAHMFARLNNLPLVVSGWTKIQKAPLLHGGDVRLYLNYFRTVREVGFLKRSRIYRKAEVVRDPPVGITAPCTHYTVYEFSNVPHWADYFVDLKPHRDEIRNAIINLLTRARDKEYIASPRPIVCAQVRMGDFRPLGEGEDFAKVGNTRTPLSYFIDLINGIREIHGTELPVLIVSDGTKNTLRELTEMPNVQMAPPNSKIVDILMMANSRILVPSAGSTFGYWAGFLGNCALIMHPDHIHRPLRPDSVNESFFEGAAVGPPQEWPRLLVNNIRAVDEFTDPRTRQMVSTVRTHDSTGTPVDRSGQNFRAGKRCS